MKAMMVDGSRRRMWCVALSFLFATASLPAAAIRSFPAAPSLPSFAEAPEYRNAPDCRPVMSSSSAMSYSSSVVCDPSAIHVAMTLDLHYLRGTVAAVYSILKHATCPENLFFHFLSSPDGHANADTPLAQLLRSTFPSLRFRIYRFDDQLVRPLISSSVRDALENPLNYARTYLADILPACVSRVIYLDSDLLVVDDITRLWSTRLTGSRVVAAPEYCNANFTNYFTPLFWSDCSLSRVFDGRSPCYFNTGVMVMDLRRWRSGGFGETIEEWMRVQKERRIYDLGSLPPFLLVFAGHVEPIEHRWNQHGLGGDNVVGSCRKLHPGPVSLLHWSGKGKPWSRLDAKSPCPLDSLWAPYDLLHKSTPPSSSSSR